MSTQLAFVLVIGIIAVSVIISIIIIRHYDIKERNMSNVAKYWEGRYTTLANIINKLVKFELSDGVLDELIKIYGRKLDSSSNNKQDDKANSLFL